MVWLSLFPALIGLSLSSTITSSNFTSLSSQFPHHEPVPAHNFTRAHKPSSGRTRRSPSSVEQNTDLLSVFKEFETVRKRLRELEDHLSSIKEVAPVTPSPALRTSAQDDDFPKNYDIEESLKLLMELEQKKQRKKSRHRHKHRRVHIGSQEAELIKILSRKPGSNALMSHSKSSSSSQPSLEPIIYDAQLDPPTHSPLSLGSFSSLSSELESYFSEDNANNLIDGYSFTTLKTTTTTTTTTTITTTTTTTTTATTTTATTMSAMMSDDDAASASLLTDDSNVAWTYNPEMKPILIGFSHDYAKPLRSESASSQITKSLPTIADLIPVVRDSAGNPIILPHHSIDDALRKKSPKSSSKLEKSSAWHRHSSDDPEEDAVSWEEYDESLENDRSDKSGQETSKSREKTPSVYEYVSTHNGPPVLRAMQGPDLRSPLIQTYPALNYNPSRFIPEMPPTLSLMDTRQPSYQLPQYSTLYFPMSKKMAKA